MFQAFKLTLYSFVFTESLKSIICHIRCLANKVCQQWLSSPAWRRMFCAQLRLRGLSGSKFGLKRSWWLSANACALWQPPLPTRMLQQFIYSRNTAIPYMLYTWNKIW